MDRNPGHRKCRSKTTPENIKHSPTGKVTGSWPVDIGGRSIKRAGFWGADRGSVYTIMPEKKKQEDRSNHGTMNQANAPEAAVRQNDEGNEDSDRPGAEGG